MAWTSGTQGVGKKGRSGRKSSLVEFDKAQTIKKAWEITDANLDKQGSLAIVLKDMVQKEESKVKIDINLITDEDISIAKLLKSNGNKLSGNNTGKNSESEGSIAEPLGKEVSHQE